MQSDENEVVGKHHVFAFHLVILALQFPVLLAQLCSLSAPDSAVPRLELVLLLLLPLLLAFSRGVHLNLIASEAVVELFSQHVIFTSRLELSERAS